MDRPSVLTIVRNALRVMTRSFHIALFIAMVTGGLSAVIVSAAMSGYIPKPGAAEKQQALFVFVIGSTLVAGAWGSVVGAWAAPAQIYLWVMEEKRKAPSLYDAINYGLNRFGRVLKPHAAAFWLIALGNIIVVPAILFGLQFAFVDAIATLDKEENHPLARSRRLASFRRGTVFRVFLCALPWWIAYQLFVSFYAMGEAWYIQFVAGTFDHLVLIFLDLCLVQVYLDLFRKREAEPAQPTAMTAPAPSA